MDMDLKVFFCCVCRVCETESGAGDLQEQQEEDLNQQLSSSTDPTGYLRMVSRNNRLNRFDL